MWFSAGLIGLFACLCSMCSDKGSRLRCRVHILSGWGACGVSYLAAHLRQCGTYTQCHAYLLCVEAEEHVGVYTLVLSVFEVMSCSLRQ